jgi:predicted metal-binding membrane protein
LGWSEPGARLKLSAPALVASGVLLVAALAWVWIVRGSMPMTGLRLGPPASFAAVWTVMMAAMMLPSALPLLYRFGQEAEGRAQWLPATGLLTATYLAVWLGFGLLLYLAYAALGMPWPNQPIVGAAAIGLAALYGLTPLKRAGQARCRQLCALHQALPFNLLRAGVVAGFRYGLSCLGCDALLMMAMLAVGMTNLAWAVLVSILAVLYRFVPRPGLRYELLVSLALAGAAVAYLLSI